MSRNKPFEESKYKFLRTWVLVIVKGLFHYFVKLRRLICRRKSKLGAHISFKEEKHFQFSYCMWRNGNHWGFLAVNIYPTFDLCLNSCSRPEYESWHSISLIKDIFFFNFLGSVT